MNLIFYFMTQRAYLVLICQRLTFIAHIHQTRAPSVEFTITHAVNYYLNVTGC